VRSASWLILLGTAQVGNGRRTTLAAEAELRAARTPLLALTGVWLAVAVVVALVAVVA
jgi:hypothetical protein